GGPSIAALETDAMPRVGTSSAPAVRAEAPVRAPDAEFAPSVARPEVEVAAPAARPDAEVVVPAARPDAEAAVRAAPAEGEAATPAARPDGEAGAPVASAAIPSTTTVAPDADDAALDAAFRGEADVGEPSAMGRSAGTGRSRLFASLDRVALSASQ